MLTSGVNGSCSCAIAVGCLALCWKISASRDLAFLEVRGLGKSLHDGARLTTSTTTTTLMCVHM